MSVLEGRLRQCRRKCAERRRYVAELELLGERLQADARRLRVETDAVKAADGAADGLARHAQLQHSIAEIEVRVAAARDALAAAEQELRRHELKRAQHSAGSPRVPTPHHRRERSFVPPHR